MFNDERCISDFLSQISSLEDIRVLSIIYNEEEDIYDVKFLVNDYLVISLTADYFEAALNLIYGFELSDDFRKNYL